MRQPYKSANGKGHIATVRKPGTFSLTTITVGKAKEAEKLIRKSLDEYERARGGSLPELMGVTSAKYLEHLKLTYKDREFHSGHKTRTRWTNAASHIRKHIGPYFEGKRTKDITVRDLHDFFDYLIDPDEACLTLVSAKHVWKTLGKTFKYAMADEVIVYNPMEEFQRHQTAAFKRDHKAARPVPLSLTQIRGLLNKSKGWDRLLAHIMLLAGLRSAELGGLRWRHIDHTQGGIWVFDGGADLSPAKEKKLIQTVLEKAKLGNATKTPASCRFIPWTPRLKHELLSAWAVLNSGGDYNLDAHVISRDGSPLSYGNLSYRIKALQNSVLGLPRAMNTKARLPGNVSNHIFRHSCVALWLTAGISFDRIAKWIGHSDSGMTIQHYGHLLQDPDLPDH